MNKLKRTIALLLCGLLVLAAAACGDTKDPSNGGTKGRYVESDITPPTAEGGPLETFLDADGTLVCYSQGLKTRCESGDGGANWTESEGPGATNPELENAWNYALLPDGSLLAAIANEEMTGIGSLLKVNPDGSTEPFSIPVLDEAFAAGKAPYVSILQPLSADRLFLSFSSGGTAYSTGDGEEDEAPEGENLSTEGSAEAGEADSEEPGEQEEDGGTQNFSRSDQMDFFAGLIDLATGEVVSDQSEWMGTGVVPSGDTFYQMDYDGSILARNLSDGSSKSSADMKVPVGDFAFNLAMAAGPEGEMYVLDGKKIQKVAPGAQAETVLDGGSYSFSGGGGMVNGLMVLEDGSFIINMQRESGSKLYKYTWDPDAEVDPARTLHVWSLNEDARLRTAINTLRSQNPDIAVEYEVALGEESGMTAEDAIKNLNTRMLNGDGPDVLLLDGCPVESYAGKGLLMDLAGKVDTSALFDALKAPFETESGTFVLPGGFKVPLLLGSADELTGAGTLDALAKKVTDGNGLREITNDEDLFANLPESERPALAPFSMRVFRFLMASSAD